ncbi:HNH endonuclease signature motif containing protein [Clostridium sp. WILCCON 0269]|uniref:HNH endonuclease signature motif containing protein n=1 Tax=Candidatus Clostridium eludens TaxID=3381663 RepID=A0ABW8SL61_9CLOT
MGRPQGNKVLHIWSEEEKEYLKQITPGHHYKEIQELMNKKFNLDFTMDQIKNAISRYKLNTGFTGQFKKGHIPANKGKTGMCAEGCKKTWFKKGSTPINHKPLGSERVNIYGYTEVKIAEPNKWRLKHQIIWEKYNGPIPKGHVVIFGNGDRGDFELDNLILVSKKQLLILNRNKLIQKDADLTRTAIIIADIHQKISERRNK